VGAEIRPNVKRDRGGWVVGEDPKTDTEMTEDVMEVLAEASKQIQ
jgi:hypothetical protein